LKLNMVVGGRPGKGFGGNLGVTDPETQQYENKYPLYKHINL